MWKVFDEADYRAAFFICILTAPICILATILRFVNTKKANRSIGAEDWLALVALIPYLTYTVMVLWIIISMDGKSVFEAGTLPPAVVLAIYKVGYVMNTMYPTNQFFTKMSLLALYGRLFSVNRHFTIWLWVIGSINMAWFMAMFWIRWFMCTPVAKVWDPTRAGHCIDSNLLLAVGEAFNAVLDFAMVALAIWMVRSLKVSRKTRWKLSVLFALGGLSGVIGFVKIGEAYGSVGSNILNAVWDEIQMAFSIVCCCAPIYRTVLPQSALLRSLWSRTVGSSGRRSTGKASGQHSLLPHALRTFGQGSSRKERRDPDDTLLNETLKTWAKDDWIPLGPHGGEVHVDAERQVYEEPGRAVLSPRPSDGVHVQRTVEVY